MESMYEQRRQFFDHFFATFTDLKEEDEVIDVEDGGRQRPLFYENWLLLDELWGVQKESNST